MSDEKKEMIGLVIVILFSIPTLILIWSIVFFFIFNCKEIIASLRNDEDE